MTGPAATPADQAPAARPGRLRQWREGQGWGPGDRGQVALVAFSHAVQHSYAAVLGVVYPFALADFHSSYAVLGAILGVGGVAGGLLQGMAGLVRRVPTRWLLGGQNLAMAVVSGIGAVAPGIAAFGAARVAGNLVSWAQHPVGSAYLTDRVPHRRGLVLAAHTTGGNIGTLVTPLAATALLTVFGWRWALGAFGLLMAVSSLLTWSRLERAKRGARTRTDQAGATDTRPAAPTRSLGRALRSRASVAVLVAGVIAAAGRGTGVLTTYIPAYLRTGLHQPALLLGILVTVVSIGALIGPIGGGYLSDRFGRRPVLFTLYGLGALALAGFVLVGASPIALAAVGLAVGMFSYSEQPIRQALFSDATQGVSARAAFGAYFAISQSIGSLWVTALGIIITTVGFQAAFFSMAASFVVAGLVIALFARTPRGED